ncbi:MAG TPA: hypothetical protein VLY63_00045, partial [Anaerolineae bacterium]|nr:hypothetical protein [Anaerolineae bacterium]
MKAGVRTVSLTLVLGLALTVVTLLLASLPATTASSDIDLVVERKAPTHVDALRFMMTPLSQFALLGELLEPGKVDLAILAT